MIVRWLPLLLAVPAAADPESGRAVGAHEYRAVVGGLGLNGLSGPKEWTVVGTTGNADWRCAEMELGTLCAAVSNGVIVSVQRWCPTQEKGWDEGCTLWNEAAKACPARPAAVQVRLYSQRLVEVPTGQEAVCDDGVVVHQVVLHEPGLTGLLTGWSIPEDASFALTFLNQHIPGGSGPRLEPLPPGVATAPVRRTLPRVPAAVPDGPQVTGPLPAAEVSRVFAAYRRELATCSPSKLVGKRVLVDFAIQGDGTVQSAVIRASDLDDAEAERCLLGKVSTMAFAKPEGEAQVRVTHAISW